MTKFSRERVAEAPPCATCGNPMGQGWVYSWLNGTARLPPRCKGCRPAPECGTRSGANAHRRRKEELCEPCKEVVRVQARRDQCSRCGKPACRKKGSSQEEIVCQECRRGARIKVCPQCDWPFDPGRAHGSEGRYNTYCSPACRVAAEVRVKKEKTWSWCEYCSEPYQQWRDSAKYCSHACYSKAITGTFRALPAHQVIMPLRSCAECGRPVMLRPGRLLCSEECRRVRDNRATNEAIKRKYREDSGFRDRVLSASHNRRARDLGLDQITSTKTLIAFLMVRDQGTCGICGGLVLDRPGRFQPSPDHVIPVSRGGPHSIENLQLSHLYCNRRKHDRLAAETPEFLPRLR